MPSKKSDTYIRLQTRAGMSDIHPRLEIVVYESSGIFIDPEFIGDLLLGLRSGEGTVDEITFHEPDDSFDRDVKKVLTVKFDREHDAFAAGVYLDTVLTERHFNLDVDLSDYDQNYTPRGLES